MIPLTELGAPGPVVRTPAYEVFVEDERLEVVIMPPFVAANGPEVRALIRVARDLGMTVRARVAHPAARPDAPREASLHPPTRGVHDGERRLGAECAVIDAAPPEVPMLHADGQ